MEQRHRVDHLDGLPQPLCQAIQERYRLALDQVLPDAVSVSQALRLSWWNF